MRCCPDCFVSPTLKAIISEEGATGDCDFCSSTSLKCVDVSHLYDSFIPIFEMYDELDTFSIDTLDFLVEDHWGPIFSDSIAEGKKDKFWDELVESRRWDKDSEYYDLTGNWKLKEPYFESVWDALVEHIKNERRFIIKDYLLESALQTLPIFLEQISEIMPTGQEFFRARVGPDDGNEPFAVGNMGSPPPEKTLGGRANPPGIPFLYLASDPITAISEVRPWKGAHVSVATFKAEKELPVIDLTGDLSISDPFLFVEDLTMAVENNTLLCRLREELSEPIQPTRSHIDYIPSQFLAEFIRDQDYYGIIYPSTLAKGKNIVLFDQRDVICKEVGLYKVDDVQYKATIY